jgi:ribulose-bisphosphate carboxylase large chain
MSPLSDRPDFAAWGRERFSATYLVQGSESVARAAAELIAIDQTVETAQEALPPEIREHLVGRIEAFEHAPNGSLVRISFPAILFGQDCAELLHVLFGTSSLRPHVRLVQFDFPSSGAAGWTGPRLGILGLRERLGIWNRPLVCAVLKPLGRSAQELSELAEEFVSGGVDLVKDDQGLADHSFCPFEERVKRCAARIAAAAARRGRPCLYAPHVSGPFDTVRRRAVYAKQAGAGALLIAPGLTGFDALRALARDEEFGLPVLSHPALLGTYTVTRTAGIAPALLYGGFPRMAGADVSIYPSYGTGYAMEREDCAAVAEACRKPMASLAATCPAAAGRMGLAQIPEMWELYGRDLLFILGSAIQSHPKGVAAACQEFMRAVTAQAASRSLSAS